MRQPVAGLVLCAPALGVQEPPATDVALRAVVPTAIVHGVRDDVVPIEVSRAFARDDDAGLVRLIEVDDDHRLSNSLDLLVRVVADQASMVRG